MSIQSSPGESPPWSVTTRWVVAILVLVILTWLFIVALPLIEAVFIGALLAYLLDPFAHFLVHRVHIKRSLAAILVFILVLLFLLSLPAALGAIAYGQFQNFSVSLNEAIQELQNWLSQPIFILGNRLSPQLLFQNIDQAIGGILALVPGGSFGFLSGLTTNLLWGLVILFSLYYFLKDGPKIKPLLVGLFPAAYQMDASRLLDDIDQIWSVFLRVQLLIFLILAILLAAGSLLVVVLYRAGLIPYSWIGLIVMLVIVYALIQQVDNLWLRPQLLGQRLQLHPGIIVLGLIGALVLSGVLGAIIVVPMIASMKLLGTYIHRKLLGLPPWSLNVDPEITERVDEKRNLQDESENTSDGGIESLTS